MARIAGVDLPRDKRIEYALPYIYEVSAADRLRSPASWR